MSESIDPFQKIFLEFSASNALEDMYLTPFEMLETYEGIVNNFENPTYPYNHILSEYDFDLLIRNVIEEFVSYYLKIKTSENDFKYTEFLQFLYTIDQKFKNITFEVHIESAENWWERRVLKKAGPVYANDVKFYFNKEIELAE